MPLDNSSYPHIIDLILDSVDSASTIQAFRLTCRHFRNKIDALIFRQVRAEEESLFLVIPRATNPLRLRIGWSYAYEALTDQGPLYRHLKIVDYMDIASFAHIPIVLDLARLFYHNLAPQARTLVFLGYGQCMADTRGLETFVVRPILGKFWYFDLTFSLRFFYSGGEFDLVLIGRVAEWQVEQFASEIAQAMQGFKTKVKFKSVTLVDAGIDEKLLFKAIEKHVCRNCRQRRSHNKWVEQFADIEWKSMSRAEYALGLNDDEKRMMLDEMEEGVVSARREEAARMQIEIDDARRASNVYEYDSPTEADRERYFSGGRSPSYVTCPRCCDVD